MKIIKINNSIIEVMDIDYPKLLELNKKITLYPGDETIREEYNNLLDQLTRRGRYPNIPTFNYKP